MRHKSPYNESKVECLSLDERRYTTTTKNSASNGKNRQLNYAKMSSACVGNGDSEFLLAALRAMRPVGASAY